MPISNDLLRYADPAIDAFVRDDLVKVMALREDLAFLTGDGAQDTPRGYLSFASAYALANGGAAGAWSSSANSTAASGGNFITSNETYTETTVVAELGGAANKLDTANVPEERRAWFMHPRTRNYLYNLLNSLGVYVFRDELKRPPPKCRHRLRRSCNGEIPPIDASTRRFYSPTNWSWELPLRARMADPHGSSREGPEYAPKPSFNNELEVRFTNPLRPHAVGDGQLLGTGGRVVDERRLARKGRRGIHLERDAADRHAGRTS